MALSDEVAAKVRQQVEFYFSDSNLPNDKFLLRSVEENEEGLVSLAVVCAFSKMKNHLSIPIQVTPDAVPADTVAAVAEALRASPALKVSDDGLRVGRSSKLLKPEEARAGLYARSLAVSPFPYKITKEEIEAFFEGHSKPYSVRMPRHPGAKAFSGYAVIEFSSAEEAERVSKLVLNFKGADLKFQSRESFEEYWSTRPSRKEEEVYTKGLIVRFKLEKLPKKQTETEQPGEVEKKEGGDVKEGEGTAEAAKVEEKPSSEEAAKKEEKKEDGLISRENVKAVFEQYGAVRFIDFSKGDTSGYVRFETPEAADKARTAAVVAEEGGLIVRDHVATLEAVQGDEETEYWKKVRESQNKRKDRFGRGGGRFEKNRGPKRSKKEQQTGKHVRLDDDDENEDEPEPKLQRTS